MSPSDFTALASPEPGTRVAAHFLSFANGVRRWVYAHDIALPYPERTSQSSAVPSPPAFGRTPANGPSPSTSSLETFSTPSRVILNPPGVPQSRFLVTTAPRSESVVPSQMPPQWFDMIYLQ